MASVKNVHVCLLPRVFLPSLDSGSSRTFLGQKDELKSRDIVKQMLVSKILGSRFGGKPCGSLGFPLSFASLSLCFEP